jgi:hypothetical protein
MDWLLIGMCGWRAYYEKHPYKINEYEIPMPVRDHWADIAVNTMSMSPDFDAMVRMAREWCLGQLPLTGWPSDQRRQWERIVEAMMAEHTRIMLRRRD